MNKETTQRIKDLPPEVKKKVIDQIVNQTVLNKIKANRKNKAITKKDFVAKLNSLPLKEQIKIRKELAVQKIQHHLVLKYKDHKKEKND